MNATLSGGRTATPWHFWLVAVLAVCWNAFGAVDYTLTELGDRAYLEGFAGLGPQEIAFLEAFPTWSVALWAVGIWGSVLGTILLLVRSRHAATAYLVSLVGAAINFAYQYTLDLPAALDTTMNKVLPLVILALIVGQWYYAKRMTDAGVLS